jgi:leader peptidase (prepilin peptidase)/N-methyltransferase
VPSVVPTHEVSAVRSPVIWTGVLAVAGSIVATLAVHRLGGSFGLVGMTVVLAGLLLALAYSDFATWRLPDQLNGLLLLIGLLVLPVVQDGSLATRGAGALAGWLGLSATAWLYERSTGRPGLGGGDAKLLGAGGAWVGLDGVASVVIWGAGLALVAVVLAAVAGAKLGRDSPIPFGPYLAAGIWLVWLFGPLVA